MEKLLETLKENRGVRDTTLSTYKRLLNKLSNEINNKDFTGIDFLKSKFSKVKSFIEGLSSSRKKNNPTKFNNSGQEEQQLQHQP